MTEAERQIQKFGVCGERLGVCKETVPADKQTAVVGPPRVGEDVSSGSLQEVASLCQSGRAGRGAG